MLVPHLWIPPPRITAIIKLCNLAWNTWHRNGWASRLPLFFFINSKVLCHFFVQVVQEHLHTQSRNSCFREGQAQPGLQPESKELSRLGPGLPWPLLSCRSWSLTLTAETHDRVWTGTADRCGEALSTFLSVLPPPSTHQQQWWSPR